VAEHLDRVGAHVTLVRVSDADHYFTDRLDELRSAVERYFGEGPGAEALRGTHA